MEGEQGDSVVGRGQFGDHLAEGNELLVGGVNVVLVHLVRAEHHVLGLAELDDRLDGLAVQDLAGGVSGVDHHNYAGVDSAVFCLAEGPLQLVEGHGPPLILV